MTPRFFRPIRDRLNSFGWTRPTGQTEDVYQEIDETTPDPGSYIESARPSSGAWATHPPMRPLPVPANREVDESSRAVFISGDNPDPNCGPPGLDSNTGLSENSPVRTINRLAQIIVPGDTIYFRGGPHDLNLGGQITINKSGTPSAWITYRSYPGELPIIESPWPAFKYDPDTAWEPYAGPGAVEGEYWSIKGGPNNDGIYPLNSSSRLIPGHFGESMIPLWRYATMYDLRSQSEWYRPELSNRNYADVIGIWQGPGAMFDTTTGHIHCRLSPTTVAPSYDYLGKGPGWSNNYGGIEDPRECELLLAREAILEFAGSYVRVQDLYFRAMKNLRFNGETHHTSNGNVEVDNIDLYMAHTPVGISLGGGQSITLRNSRIRGPESPWSNRWNSKNRAGQPSTVGCVSQTLLIDRCEISDSHNALDLGGETTTALTNMTVSRCLLINAQDDMFFLLSQHATRQTHVFQNHFVGSTLYCSFRSGVIVAESNPDVGLYMRRNFFDMRRFIYRSPPSEAEGVDGANIGLGYPNGEHGSSVRPTSRVYHNLFVYRGTSGDGTENNIPVYGANWGSDFHSSKLFFPNNIVIVVNDTPPQNVSTFTPAGHTPPVYETHNNLEMRVLGAVSAATRSGDIHADPKFTTPLADIADLIAAIDAHLLAGSPAINAGWTLPASWPDEFRAIDEARVGFTAPTIGPIPYTYAGEVFGPGADL